MTRRWHDCALADADRVAILNGFGRSIGDSIVGLQALSVALRRGAVPAGPVLFRLPGLRPMVRALYDAAADLVDVRELPWADETPARPFPPGAAFARCIDIRDFAFDPAFRGVAMIDFFLSRLGLHPGAVPAAERRNTWLAPRVHPAPPSGLAAGYTLVCPRSSMSLRDMPEEVHRFILGWLERHMAAPVLTQGAPVSAGNVRPAPEAGSLAELCGLVAGAGRVISTDTAMVHLADAFGVPCLAFFTTHRPEWRVRDYPLCAAIHLPPVGLPAALEFERGPADREAARAAWFARGVDLAWLRAALAAWAGDAVLRPAPQP